MLDVLLTVLSGSHLLYLAAGALLGVVIGILPGLGGTAGMALLLPFVYGMEPSIALALMIGLLGVVATGDTFTSVLMGVPGSAGSQATVLDGFPMAKRGEAARALGAAFLASMVGGLIGALILSFTVQIARPIVLAFGSAELLMLALFGLSLVGVLSGSSLARGVAACALGLLLGALGPAPATGHFRMTFGSHYLSDGLQITIVALALFALPEIIALLRAGGSIAPEQRMGGGLMQGVRDAIRHRWIVFRSALLGCTIGAIPGLGGAVIDWISYANTVQVSKDKSQFGKGDIRGVIAPEAANNAKDGGALIPTLIFGIPGSGATAILLGGLLLIGIVPGPKMIEDRIDTVYLIIWSLALANIVGAGICLGLAGPLSRLTRLPYASFAPIMLAIIMFGAYQASRNWGDFLSLMAIGAFAILLKRYGWPRPPLLIGFVLAPGVEVNLYQAVQFYGMSWLGRPIVVVLLVVTVLSVLVGMRHRVQTELAEERAPNSRGAEIVFALFIAGLGLLAVFDTADIPFLSGVFPWAAALVLVPTALFVAFEVWRQPSERFAPFHLETALASPELRFLAWLVALLALIWAIGFLSAVALFVAAFLLFEARLRIPYALLMAAVTTFALYMLGRFLVVGFPRGALIQLV